MKQCTTHSLFDKQWHEGFICGGEVKPVMNMFNALLQSDMSNYLLRAISCLCLLHAGVHAETCTQAVLAEAKTFNVPAGGSLTLSCVVQHCGGSWTGSWMWTNSTNIKARVVNESGRHHLINVTLSADKAKLILKFLNLNQSDEGFYGCRVAWGQNDIEEGHSIHVNVTAAVASQRRLWHRVLVCAGASLCLPIILGLARCLSSEVKPQPLPRTLSTHAAAYRNLPHPTPQPPPRRPIPQKRSTSSLKAAPKSQQKPEVVYADISQGALKQQGATREPAEPTVYSSLKFS